MGIGRFAYTPILPHMPISNVVAGLLATTNYAGYLLGATLTGIIPFKQRRTFYLRISIVISLLTTAAMGLIHVQLVWYILRFISGISSAFVFVLSASIMLDQLAKRGKTNWSGFYYGGVGFGIFLTGVLVPELIDHFNWEGAWLGLAVLSVAFSAVVWIWLKDDHYYNERGANKEQARQVPPQKWILWLTIAYGLEGFGYIITGTFIVLIADSIPDFNGNATIVWLVVGLAAIPSCIIWSTLANKWGFVKSLIVAMVLQAIGIVFPVFLMSKTGLVISAILFGATFMGITAIVTTLARHMYPANSSRVIGSLTAVYAVGQMIGPTIAGLLAAITNNFDGALLFAASVILLGSVLLVNGIHFERKTTSNICQTEMNARL